MKRQVQQLDPTRRSFQSQEFDSAIRGKIVGQEEGVRALVDLYQVFCAGMCPQGRPVGSLLFLGPTGSGKTRIVEAAAEILFGDPRAVIKVDCAEFQHSHEIAKLIGSNLTLSAVPTDRARTLRRLHSMAVVSNGHRVQLVESPA